MIRRLPNKLRRIHDKILGCIIGRPIGIGDVKGREYWVNAGHAERELSEGNATLVRYSSGGKHTLMRSKGKDIVKSNRWYPKANQ